MNDCTPIFTPQDPPDPKNAEDVAMDDDLFDNHDCHDFNLRADGKTPETADDCEVCWLANK